MSPTLLRNRLVLLHHFSDVFCPGIAMFPLGFTVSYILNSQLFFFEVILFFLSILGPDRN